MFHRFVFLLITAFWVTMNVLLWRSEFRPRDAVGAAVPVETVWRKILTAPDNSSLMISHHKKNIGFCRWSPEVLQEQKTTTNAADAALEDMVTKPLNYTITLEGNVALAGISNRLRVDFNATLATNHLWQEFKLRLGLRPDTWEFRAVAAEQTLHFKMEGDEGALERVFSFADLQNPQALLREFAGPLPLPLLDDLDLPAGGAAKPVSLGLVWEAHEHWLKLGHSPVRVYRLQTTLLDRYPIVITISRAGEILRVQLPDEISFLNDQFNNP
jgi:hypothetical protein